MVRRYHSEGLGDSILCHVLKMHRPMGVEPMVVQVPTNVCDSVVLFYFDGVVSCDDCGEIASKKRRVSYVKYGSVE